MARNSTNFQRPSDTDWVSRDFVQSLAANVQELDVAWGMEVSRRSTNGQEEPRDGGDVMMCLPEAKTPARGRGGCFVVFARSRKLSLIGAQCQPGDRSYERLTPMSTPIYTDAWPIGI